MIALIEELGTLGMGQILAPAVELARDGFTVSTEQAYAFGRQASIYAENPAVAEFYPEGRPVEPGDRVTRPDLAETLEAVGSGGREAFYGGRAGEDISQALSGMITPEDMTSSQAEWVDPIETRVVGLSAWTIPPNSQGYLGPATLAVFEMLDPPQDPTDPTWWHLLTDGLPLEHCIPVHGRFRRVGGVAHPVELQRHRLAIRSIPIGVPPPGQRHGLHPHSRPSQ
jgi:gamma-glutamyltranspeptidase/glutathione hydrolase